MSEGMAWIAGGWLLAFAGFNGALFVSFRKRTRAERRFLKESDGTDVDPIQAAWWLGTSSGEAAAQQESYAVEVAVRLLIAAGDAEVDERGRVTLTPGPSRSRADPVLAALVAAMRRHGSVTVLQLRTEPRFTRFRTVLESRRAPLRRWFGNYRVPAVTAGFTVAIGIAMHAMIERHGVPGLPDQDPGYWTFLWIPVWAVLAALAALWPPETSRPWPRFTPRCRAALSQALVGESTQNRDWVSRAVYPAPRGRQGKPGAGRRRPSRAPHSGKGPGDIGDPADVDTSHDGGDSGGDSGGGD
ncbi:hypothetical protein ACH4TV_37425 [Streptomyces sp. NPDC020898]|uniref:hypothetical protein n=1 Tax=Streptomyces sp. NPDC020898 TaxID=3365101 RepID=UPI0037955F4B